MRPIRLIRVLAALSIFTLLFPAPSFRAGLEAQGIVPGQLIPRMVSRANPTQSYALYVPSAYDSTRTWPVLFAMDPDGCALAPMKQFMPAAEKYGYVVISSYNTASDGPVEPNIIAINAMIPDVQSMLKIDMRRYYMAGFSGTARAAWDFAAQLNGAVAGIFGAGASGMTLNKDTLSIRPALAWFGTAGVHDFNYEEMRAYDTELRGTGVPHRVRFFEGRHQWPPDSLATQGIEYFQLRAMKLGFIPVDSAFVRYMYDTDTTLARAAESARHMEDALNRWREIDREYGSLRAADAPRATGEVERLEVDGKLIDELKCKQGFADAFLESRARVAAWYFNARKTSRPVDVARAVKELRIEVMRKTAAKKDDKDAADAAQRQIEDLFAQLSFYHPSDALSLGLKQLALACLDIADAAKPGMTRNLRIRARASQ